MVICSLSLLRSPSAKRDESDNEAEKDNRDDAKEAERDKEKEEEQEHLLLLLLLVCLESAESLHERRKEKEKERRKEKEKEKEREKDKDKVPAKKEKARKTKAKKKREEESYSYSSSSDESRSRRRKKKKKEVKKKKKAQDKKKKRLAVLRYREGLRKDGDCPAPSTREWEATEAAFGLAVPELLHPEKTRNLHVDASLLEIGSSSSGDLEIVAETSGPILALANSTPPEPTMETAFEEVTDEQRPEQAGPSDASWLDSSLLIRPTVAEGEGENETKEAPTRLEVKASDGDSVLAKLRAQADKTDAQEKDEKALRVEAEGKAAEDEKSATSEGEDEGEEGGEQASPAAQAEKGEKTAAEEESAEEPAGSKEDEATEPNVEDSAAYRAPAVGCPRRSSPAVRSKEQKDQELFPEPKHTDADPWFEVELLSATSMPKGTQEKKAAAPSGEAGEGDEEAILGGAGKAQRMGNR
ncbi:hypothetical protein AK812_SmicGene33830 [Symbiodinium microadriaticum]|uniref:Uncharacterized protein n=1 Tax=Symbiodinium microadriaticum TaxID=2951 RepID=A0A1Q9CQP6_SYMMI|nr:hypothetical protein AK812_SmicGene33830 [Symbiodinium microadriaticum]